SRPDQANSRNPSAKHSSRRPVQVRLGDQLGVQREEKLGDRLQNCSHRWFAKIHPRYWSPSFCIFRRAPRVCWYHGGHHGPQARGRGTPTPFRPASTFAGRGAAEDRPRLARLYGSGSRRPRDHARSSPSLNSLIRSAVPEALFYVPSLGRTLHPRDSASFLLITPAVAG